MGKYPIIGESLRMRKMVAELKNKHEGEDIWILASGPSMNFISPNFFLDKITIGVNEMYLSFPLTYVVWKESRNPDPNEWGSEIIITSDHNCGNLELAKTEMKVDHYVFEHNQNGNTEIDFSVIGTDKIVVSYSTITSAMHIGAYMGAANLILCGHDCGLLDGKMNLDGYPTSLQGDLKYRKWIREIEPQTTALREELLIAYDCHTYSLNPFVNLGLEGHDYKR